VSKSFHAYILKREEGLAEDGTEHPTEIKTFFGDGVARNAIAHLGVSIPTSDSQTLDNTIPDSTSKTPNEQKLMFITDRSGSLAVLPHPTTATHNSGIQPLLQTTLPQSITRLAHAPVRPPWHANTNTPGILASNIIGTTVDGTVYSLAILDQSSRILLKFLENLVLWDRVGVLVRGKRNDSMGMVIIDPEPEAWRAQTQSPTASFSFGAPGWSQQSPGSRSARGGKALYSTAGNYCVNADRLESFLLPGGSKQLLELLQRSGWDSEVDLRVGNDVETRQQRFMELCEKALPPEDEELDGPAHGRLKQVVGQCVAWLRDIAGDFL
jgi:hypothetical protein